MTGHLNVYSDSDRNGHVSIMRHSARVKFTICGILTSRDSYIILACTVRFIKHSDHDPRHLEKEKFLRS